MKKKHPPKSQQKEFTKAQIKKLQEKNALENYYTIDGPVNALIEVYNEMIDAYNYIS